jgi:Fur family zinc uptake transcriptional regulator
VHAPEHNHPHAAQFLICHSCKRVTELEDHAISHALADAAARVGFKVERAMVEVEGVCAACAQAN